MIRRMIKAHPTEKADSKASFLSGLRHRLALRPSGLVYRP
jgi:hypothetical protein